MRFHFGIALTLVLALTLPLSADPRLEDYNVVDLSNWQPRTADSAMALLEPLYRYHPESDEGYPTLRIDMRKDGPGTLIVDVIMEGYLDDSVAGEEYRGFISRTGAGWWLVSLGRRHICARGANPGVPTKDLCP